MRRTKVLSHGFTFIEVLISLGAMMVGILALWGLHMSSLKMDSRTNYEALAVFWAERDLEQLRALALTNFAQVTGSTDTSRTPFTIRRQVTALTGWRKNVSVTVSWTEKVRLTSRGIDHSIQVSTILTRL